MDKELIDFVFASTGATRIESAAKLQDLWSGYGEIVRLTLNTVVPKTAILKNVTLPEAPVHPRGWNTPASHARKVHSYEVEAAWYAQHARQVPLQARIPACLGSVQKDNTFWLLLEDMDDKYPGRRSALTVDECVVGLEWLAHFHAAFVDYPAPGVWPVGTYWHLATRQDEYALMSEGPVKDAAEALDRRLNTARFQTLVHGDAKAANFCFSPKLDAVAAVDFQYVGRGVGIKDVTYFLGSCLEESDCEAHEEALLDVYFNTLRLALNQREERIDVDALVAEWRDLYAIAWTDFYRFLLGWMPGHKKINNYTRKLSEQALSAV